MASTSKGACNKAPGRNGICLEFFKLTGTASIMICWPYSIQCTWMFGSCNNRNVTSYCAYLRPTFPPHQRTIDQLFGWTHYKIVARIRTKRLRSTLSDMLHPSQDCGVPGNTIFDAVTTVRDAIAYAELTHTAIRTSNLHFRAAFDRISHTYLLGTLKAMAGAWNSLLSNKRCITRPSLQYKLMTRLLDPFPYNVPLGKAVQWAWYYSLWFWFHGYVCWSDITRASELGIR
jgi:hypothetical protein